MIFYSRFMIEKGRTMKIHSQTHILILLFIGILSLGVNVNAEQVRLVGDDLSAWRSPTGQWQVVGKVFKNPANE